MATTPPPAPTLESEASHYLTSLLNRTLRIHTTDGRMFVGEFKCTDNETNTILAQSHEYRLPSPPSLSSISSITPPTSSTTPPQKVTQNMTSRYLGLVVVPGKHITKIELEEFACQHRTRNPLAKLGVERTVQVKVEKEEGMEVSGVAEVLGDYA